MPQLNMIEAIRSALADAMPADPPALVLGEDVGVKGGVFLATDGLLARYGEDRVVDMPIAEASIVGIAIGASLHGLRPVAEIQFADYIHPAIDQILNEAARFRYRSNGDRSEEHTSELQSRRDLVCRLLLEKKKNNKNVQ